MRRTTGMLAILVFISINTFSQTIEEIRTNRQFYLSGEGSGVTIQEATNHALADISMQLSVQVKSKYSSLINELITDSRETYQQKFEGIIQTYSNATLRNTQRIILNDEPDARVLLYIKREDVDKIFSDRERKIKEFVRNGLESCESFRISDALRYYYWALTLLRSMPNPNDVIVKGPDGTDRMLLTWLPLLINNVLSDLEISINEIKEEHGVTVYILNIFYKNHPTRNFDYSYFTGRDWSNIHSARDGLGIAEFTSPPKTDHIRFKVEYEFSGEANIDLELRDVLNSIPGFPFRNSHINVSIKPNGSELSAIQQKPASQGIQKIRNSQPYNQVMQQVITAIRNRDHLEARSLFTHEGFELYEKLLQYGQARVLREQELHFYRFEDKVICRAVPMSFYFRNNNRTFVEDVVFYFDNNMKISHIAFSLGETAIRDIMDKDVWSERVRMVIINFMENYKTAYALKRLDYIESIFDEHALIITGTVLQPIQSNGEVRFRNNEIVRFNRFDKESFIRHLRHSFASNEFINLRFEDNLISKSGTGGEEYGIQIKQHYFSSTYGDSGYLFLLINFDDPDKPTILVRTWQPEKNEDGSIYGIGSFF